MVRHSFVVMSHGIKEHRRIRLAEFNAAGRILESRHLKQRCCEQDLTRLLSA
jgi:hypothetical protein